MKAGTLEHKTSGDSEGMIAALLDMAAFCDRQLRLKEDDGVWGCVWVVCVCVGGGGGGMGVLWVNVSLTISSFPLLSYYRY